MEFFLAIVSMFLSYALIRATFIVFGVENSKNLPPGPTQWPIIGSLHLLGDQPHQSLAKLAKIHGPIMSLKLGQTTTLVISSPEAAKEVLQKKDLDFANRHVPNGLHAHNYSGHAVTFLPVGTPWRALRKIINANIASGKSLDANQHLRNQKVKELIAYCQKASVSNECVDIGRAAFRTSLNLVSNTIFSKDMIDPYEDSGKEFKELIGNIMIELGKPNLVDFFPVLKKLDPQGIRKRLSIHFGKLLDVFEELIDERLEMRELIQGDLLDVCLKIIQDNQEEINRTHIKILFLVGKFQKHIILNMIYAIYFFMDKYL